MVGPLDDVDRAVAAIVFDFFQVGDVGSWGTFFFRHGR